jgi:monoamine oxidase
VAWHKQAWSLGPWVHWERPDAPAYVLLNQPHGRVHFAGDVLAQLGAWQEGAALSAQRAVRAIATELRSQPAAAA